MLGFIIATVGVVAAVKVLRRRFGGGGCHGGYGYGAGPQGGGWQRSRGFGGPRWWLRSMFRRLETNPGQEKAIVGALDELRASRVAVRDELRQTREDLARAVAAGVVDDATLEETFARHDRLLARLRVSFVEMLKKTTEALDEPQRKRLAGTIEGRGWFGGGPRWEGPDVWA
jgi:Spy/CpxP family protein refolding chaperone